MGVSGRELRAERQVHRGLIRKKFTKALTLGVGLQLLVFGKRTKVFIPPRSLNFSSLPSSLCYRSPALIGCFVVDRKYFGEIGLLDEGMEIYGGENVELGIRVSRILRMETRDVVLIYLRCSREAF